MLKKLQHKKIKAGALQYVLVISVIIAIIVFAFISLIYLQKKLQLKNSVFTETIQNVTNGFNYLETNNIPYNIIQEQQFSDNSSEKTILLKKKWGVYDLGIVSSSINKESFQKVGLLGMNYPKREALILKENNQALVLVGRTNIIGNVSLPKQGVKRGNISGTSYYGNKLIYGNTSQSNSSLPDIKSRKHIKDVFKGDYNLNSIESLELSENLYKTQSFTKETLVFESNTTITLQEVKLEGNIIIKSNRKITVKPSADLKDIILIAPEIIIEKNSVGNFQAFAANKIEVQENCQLHYPTVLVVSENINTSNEKEESIVLIAKNSTVKGSVMFLSGKKETQYVPQIIVSNASKVIGEVYCEKNLELLGSIYGSVYTNNFITKQFGSIYINHIYNGEINSKNLPKQYCGLIGQGNQKPVKWLY